MCGRGLRAPAHLQTVSRDNVLRSVIPFLLPPPFPDCRVCGKLPSSLRARPIEIDFEAENGKVIIRLIIEASRIVDAKVVRSATASAAVSNF